MASLGYAPNRIHLLTHSRHLVNYWAKWVKRNLKGEYQQTANVFCRLHGRLANHMTAEEGGARLTLSVRMQPVVVQCVYQLIQQNNDQLTLTSSCIYVKEDTYCRLTAKIGALCLNLQSERRLQWILHQHGDRDRRQVRLFAEPEDTHTWFRTCLTNTSREDEWVWRSVLRGQLKQRLNLSGVQTDLRWLEFDQHLNLKHRKIHKTGVKYHAQLQGLQVRGHSSIPSGCFWMGFPAHTEVQSCQQNTPPLLGHHPET